MAKHAIAPYKWQITKALDADLKDCVGVFGPGNWGGREPSQMAVTQEVAKSKGWDFKKFRMGDDDGNHYLEGVIMGNPKVLQGFEPLDDYGEGGLGCTWIEYWEPGKGGGWKQL